MSRKPLKLLAQDAEDVQVVAALLQDAIAPVCDMLYRPEAKNFVLVVQRFCWDGDADQAGASVPRRCERVCCALDIDGVEAVQRMGFEPHETGRLLELLTLILDGDQVQFIFAGAARLRLKVGQIRLRIEDFGEPWPVGVQPCHEAGARVDS